MLLGAEVVDAAGVSRAAQALGQPDPLPDGGGWLLLLEVADGGTAQGFEPVADQVVAVATNPADRRRLWALRERQTELYATLPGLQKLDVSVRLADLDSRGVGDPRGRGRLRAGPLAATAGPHPSGHAHGAGRGEPTPGSGSSATPSTATCTSRWSAADGATADRVLRAVAELGGSISAEHGIGRLKAGQLHLARSSGADRLDAPDQGHGRSGRAAQPRRAHRARPALTPRSPAVPMTAPGQPHNARRAGRAGMLGPCPAVPW